MSNVSKFIIDGKTINVTDYEARNTANTANNTAMQAKTASEANTADITALKKLPRLTATYSEGDETITFNNSTHAS